MYIKFDYNQTAKYMFNTFAVVKNISYINPKKWESFCS